MSVTMDRVRSFWNDHPCQGDLSTEPTRKQYFEEISRKRYEGREWHVPLIADFESFHGRKVLEIGCGIATDGLEFARSGAQYTGIDLTPQAIEIAKERFELFGAPGEFHLADASDRLPFSDNSFDHVYTFGVIHHSPNTEAIVREAHRVLRPGGTITAMVYNRSSINYKVEILVLRRIARLLLVPPFMPKVLASLFGLPEWKLAGHREIMLRGGRLTKEQWLSMNTDGPQCPLSKVYGKKEAAELFKDFVDVRQEVWEFNSEHWSFIGRMIPTRLERAIGRRWGWHRIVYGKKAF